tara:strand:- start:509 stop:1342 length:834 start_codon:yes stop_codon:yes gene_type:complete
METKKKYGMKETKLYNEMEIERKKTDGIVLDSKSISNLTKDISLKPSKISSLFKKLKMEERKVMKDLMDEVELLENTKSNIKELKKTIRRIQNDIRRGYDDKDLVIDIKFRKKIIKGNEYIYGRVYWDGSYDGSKDGRREISIGSVSKVIDEINVSILGGEYGYPSKRLPKSYKSIPFDIIKEDKKVMKLIGLVGKKRFRNFLFKSLLSRRSLGYRIRCKDMVGYSKSYDIPTLSKNTINHMDVVEMDNIIKNYDTFKDTQWYDYVVERRKKIDSKK